MASYTNRANEPQNTKELFADFSLPKGGIHGNGMNYESGEGTKWIKGLQINDRLTNDRDILVTQYPRPTALSTLTPLQASDSVAKGLAGFENRYAKAEKYQCRRGDIEQE
jgi:hypothetical protein